MFGVKINKTIRLLMLSDIFLITGFGLIAPILSIFIKENLIGGTIFAAGLASALFILTRSVIQLPFSKYVDSHDNKVKWLIFGTLLISIVPFIYIFSTNIWHIYLAQILNGIGAGFAHPTWLGLWSTHLDKKHESFEWSLYSTLAGIGTAVTALIGALIAEFIGFSYTFIFVGLMALVGFFILFGLEKKRKKLTKVKITHYHKKRKLVGHIKNIH
ncbi:MAG: MFS transporter [Candidatus Woesearchaeota archaeon]